MALEHKGEFQVEHGFGLPNKTTTERLNYVSPREGYVVFDTDIKSQFNWDGSTWIDIGSPVVMLGDLTDVDTSTTAPVTGDALLFNGTSFVNRALVSADIGDLDDNVVNLTTEQTDIAGRKTFTDTLTVQNDNANINIINTDPSGRARINFFDNTTDWQGQIGYDNFVDAMSLYRVSSATSTITTRIDLHLDRVEVNMRVNGVATQAADPSTTLTTKGYVDNAISTAVDASDSIADLTDTIITSPNNGHVLVRSGPDWINRALTLTDLSDFDADDFATGAEGDLASTALQNLNSTSITELSDVVSTSPGIGEVLVYVGNNYENRALTQSDVSGTATTAQGALADTAVQPGDATSTLTNNDAFVDLTTAQTIAGAKTFSDDINANGNVMIAGNLTVSGTTTSVNSTNTDIVDSIITLNKGETGAGVTNPNQAGLEIDRGTEDNKFLIWSESNDRFGEADTNVDGDVDVSTFRAFAYEDTVASASHIATFNAGDWTTGATNTFLLTQATHGVAVSDIYDVTVFEGSSKVGIEVSIAANGDVTLITAGAVFAGRVKVSL